MHCYSSEMVLPVARSGAVKGWWAGEFYRIGISIALAIHSLDSYYKPENVSARGAS